MKPNVLGIDIGGTNIEIGIVTDDGQILKTFHYPTKQFPTAQDFAKTLQNIINQTKDYNIIGIGIGAPTANFFTGQIEYAPNLQWKGIVPLEKLVNQATNLPTKITNDANAVAHAELRFGAGKNLDNFTVLTLGTGLGSGIVVNHKVLYGSHGLAGEFGHTQVDPNGRLCNCGRKGCLETYVSIRGIMLTYKELGGKQDLTPKQIFELAKNNDPIALQTYRKTAQILGSQLADLVHLFDPQAIFLYGGIAHAHELIIPTARDEMERNLLNAFKNKVQIKPSQLLDKQGAILGAAALIWENLKN